MNDSVRLTTLASVLLGLAAGSAFAHCEIPCGIYDDEMRVKKLEEDIQLIEKAMGEIQTLSKDPGKNINQLVRWVQAKEDHADDIREIATQYFLAQRVKPDNPKYTDQLTLIHKLILESVQAKQTTDPAHAGQLRELTKSFRAAYFAAEQKEHLKKEHPKP